MIKTIVKIIKSYWDMDIKPFMKVMSKTTTSNKHIKQWEDDEDIEIYGKQHKHWEDWEMTEMPHVSDTSRDRDISNGTSDEIKRFLGHLNEKEE